MEALRPCPFCGRLGTIRNRATPSAKPYCGFCPACGCESGQYETRELAAAAWNNRAVAPLVLALYDALCDAEVVLRMLKVSAPCDMSTNDMGKSRNLSHFGTLEAVQKTLKNCEDSR